MDVINVSETIVIDDANEKPHLHSSQLFITQLGLYQNE